MPHETSQSSSIRAIVIMGVSGAGKTTVGSALARSLGWEFADADDFHSAANKAKMHRGIGLTDADRAPWLAALQAYLSAALHAGRFVILACSALRQSYRDALVDASTLSSTRFIYLNVPREVLEARLAERKHSFATPRLLESQFETLEEPSNALWVDGTCAVPDIVAEIRAKLGV